MKWYWLSFPHLSAGKQTSSIIMALMCLCVSNSNSIQRFHFWTQPRIQTQFFRLKFCAARVFVLLLNSSNQNLFMWAVCKPLKTYYNNRSAMCHISCVNILFYGIMGLLPHQIFSKCKCILLCHWTDVLKWFVKAL